MNNENKIEIPNGWTALMRASMYGYLEIVKGLIKLGADVNAKNNYGRTALILASRNGHLEVVKELIKSGADVNAQSKWGKTALMRASYWGHLEIVKELIKAGADVNAKDKYGKTALIIAREEGYLEIVKELEKIEKLEKVKRSEIMNNENIETKETEKIITKAQAEKYKSDLAILTQKVQHAKRRIAQANYQYKNSVAKIEKQKQRAEITKELISITKIKIANQLANAQKYQELLEKYEQQKAGK